MCIYCKNIIIHVNVTNIIIFKIPQKKWFYEMLTTNKIKNKFEFVVGQSTSGINWYWFNVKIIVS